MGCGGSTPARALGLKHALNVPVRKVSNHVESQKIPVVQEVVPAIEKESAAESVPARTTNRSFSPSALLGTFLVPSVEMLEAAFNENIPRQPP